MKIFIDIIHFIMVINRIINWLYSENFIFNHINLFINFFNQALNTFFIANFYFNCLITDKKTFNLK
jgi:hypothetical protein